MSACLVLRHNLQLRIYKNKSFANPYNSKKTGKVAQYNNIAYTTREPRDLNF